MKIDQIVRCLHVYTLAGDGLGYRSQADILIDAGTIIGIEDTGSHDYTADEIHEMNHHLVVPGLIDAHMHTGLNILRGLAQDTNAWMMQGLAPFEEVITKEEKLLGSKLAILEGSRAGTTTFGDYESDMDGVCQFLTDMGLRGLITTTVREAKKRVYLAGEIYEFDPKLGEESFHKNLALFDRWHNQGNLRVFFGPQGADFLSPELLLKVQAAAKERNTRIHMHVQQGDRETYQIEKRYGKRPVDFLKDLGYLDETLLAVHLTDCRPDEAEIVARSGASMLFCPSSIGIIDGLVPPAYAFMYAGGLVGLGSDQAPGNNNHNVLKEMQAAALFTKIAQADPEVLPAWKALRMATIEGAKACGIDDLVGSLEVGKRADLIAIDLNTPTMSPVYTYPMRNLIPNLVYSARGNEVDFSMVSGEVILENGQFKKQELTELLHQANQAAESIGKRAADTFYRVNGSNARWMEQGLL